MTYRFNRSIMIERNDLAGSPYLSLGLPSQIKGFFILGGIMESIFELILEIYPEQEFLKIEGHDDSIIGVESKTMRLIYSVNKIITDLSMSGMDWEEAEEFYDYNIESAHIGDKTPILCDDRNLF